MMSSSLFFALETVSELETERAQKRGNGLPIADVEAILLPARKALHGLLFSESVARRDAGDHAGAVKFAKLGARQEHLIETAAGRAVQS